MSVKRWIYLKSQKLVCLVHADERIAHKELRKERGNIAESPTPEMMEDVTCPSRRDDSVARAGEPGGEATHLGGLAGAVQALECDEGSAWHGDKSIASRTNA